MDWVPDGPPSSPPSSPSFAIDSSPLNSPLTTVHDGASDDSLSSFSLGHPLAASVKANRTLPQYEKKYASPSFSQSFSERPTKKHRATNEAEHVIDDVFGWKPAFEYDRQAAIWDESITKVVDEGHGTMSLSSQNLTYISKRISELGNFVAIPARSEQANASCTSSAYMGNGGRLFTRTATAPASTTAEFFASRASGPRTSSTQDVLVGSPREEIQLFLACNQIRSLPRELFCLQKMTVLIIRNNHLTHIPPEIAQLANLRELIVSNNQISFIPSEMLKMKLSHLLLHPNPFLQPPTQLPRSLSRSNSRIATPPPHRNRVVSQTIYVQPRVTPLVELAYRILFSHRSFPNEDPFAEQNDTPTLPAETVLSQHQLPLEREIAQHMPGPISDLLNICVPGAVDVPESHPAAERAPTGDITGISVCPCPHHGKYVYVNHAEERYTWEESVAGANVGGAVPVRWRGCQWGCLDFLGREEDGRGSETVPQDDDDLDVDVGEEEEMGVVQLIEFGGEGYADFM